MDRAGLSPLLRSFERTITSYLQSACQAEAFLTGHGISLTAYSQLASS